jgi:hypothetical protein
MDIQISKNMYSRKDLDAIINQIEGHATIHYAEKEDLKDDDVINHMPYNSGKFFEKTIIDPDFLKKSLLNDIEFSKQIFG